MALGCRTGRPGTARRALIASRVEAKQPHPLNGGRVVLTVLEVNGLEFEVPEIAAVAIRTAVLAHTVVVLVVTQVVIFAKLVVEVALTGHRGETSEDIVDRRLRMSASHGISTGPPISTRTISFALEDCSSGVEHA